MTRTVVAVLASVCIGALAGCTTQPLSAAGSASAAPSTSAPAGLPSGPRTASLPTDDPQPVATNPVSTLPVTVRSFDGTSTTVRSTARIVAFDQYGTYGTTVFTLGLGNHLVGRDTSTDFPAARHIANVTAGAHQVNVESILALKPTVVLTDSSLPSSATALKQLRAAGIAVVTFDHHRTVEGATTQIQAVADALGVGAAGRALASRTRSQIAAARAMVPTGADQPRIAFVYARGTGLVILGGPGAGPDDLITLIGGTDAGTAAGLRDPFTSLTSEGIIKAAPDVILMMSGGVRSVGGTEGMLKVPGVAATPAGRDRRFVDMDDGVLLSFGPRVGEVAQALARAVYGARS